MIQCREIKLKSNAIKQIFIVNTDLSIEIRNSQEDDKRLMPTMNLGDRVP